MTFQRLASYAHVLAVFGKTNMMMIMMMMTRWSRYDWLATFTFSKSKLDFTMDLGPHVHVASNTSCDDVVLLSGLA